MFDIGFPELMLVAVVMLLVLGPERLPEALRTAGLWLGRLQRSFNSVKTEIEREIGMDEIRRQLHNEGIMAEMKKLEQDLKSSADPRYPGTGDINTTLPEDSLKLEDDAATDAEATAAEAAAAEGGAVAAEGTPTVDEPDERPESPPEIASLSAEDAPQPERSAGSP
ncbi:MAG: Sec-independent protein translocase protein TatB [Pseudomonadota bacterium]